MTMYAKQHICGTTKSLSLYILVDQCFKKSSRPEENRQLILTRNS